MIKSPYNFGKYNVLIIRIKPENASRQYTLATQLLRVMKLVIVIEFILITMVTFFLATNKIQPPGGAWFTLTLAALPLLPVIYYLWRAWKLR